MVRYSIERLRDTSLIAKQALSKFKPLTSGIESVYLVEASPALRDTQKQLLCGDAPLVEIDIGFRSTSKYSKIPVTWCEDIRLVPNGKFYPTSQHKLQAQLTIS